VILAEKYGLKFVGVSHNPPPCRFVACRGFASAVDWKNSVETTIPYYFPLNPAWLIGILIMVHYNPPHNWVVFHPPTKTLKKPGALFIVQVILLGFLLHHDLLNPMGNLGKKNGSETFSEAFHAIAKSRATASRSTVRPRPRR